VKYGESATAQRRANVDNLLRLRDITDERISITGYEQRQSRYNQGTYLILRVVLSEPEERTVKVVTGATVVMEQVIDFFKEHPGETLDAVITKRPGREDREYWDIMDPDVYEKERAQSRPVDYPTQQEGLVRPTDVAAKVDRMEDIPF
jgi:hypothetical protein